MPGSDLASEEGRGIFLGFRGLLRRGEGFLWESVGLGEEQGSRSLWWSHPRPCSGPRPPGGPRSCRVRTAPARLGGRTLSGLAALAGGPRRGVCVEGSSVCEDLARTGRDAGRSSAAGRSCARPSGPSGRCGPWGGPPAGLRPRRGAAAAGVGGGEQSRSAGRRGPGEGQPHAGPRPGLL